MSDKILNWTPDKGSPYQVPRYKYEYEQPIIKILGKEDTDRILNIHTRKGFSFFRVFFPVNYYLYKISAINDLLILDLLVGIHYYDRENNVSEYIDDFNELPDKPIFDCNKPVQVYASYPFSKMLEMTITPFKKIVTNRDTGKEHVMMGNNIGYIVWQISKAYENIYQNHEKEVGIYGHVFSDLAFGSIDFINNNVITLNLDS